MTKTQRQQAILTLLHEKGELQISTLCRIFSIVPMTARRDLRDLESQGTIIRTHGGAIAMEKKTYDAQTPLASRLKTNTLEKEKIAKFARTLLQTGDSIFIASGSTIDIFSRTLRHYKPLTIVTDAINIAYQLYTDTKLNIYVIGGELRSNSLTLTGSIAQHNLRQFRLKRAFIGINGIDEEGNLYSSSIVESGILEDLFQTVDNVYVLADASKIGHRDFVRIQNSKPYILLTSTLANPTCLEHYREKGIQVHVVSL